MLKRLVVLTLLQLSNKMNLKVENKKRFIASIAMRFLAIVLIAIVMTLVLYFISNILYIPVNNFFMIFILMITQSISIIAATNGLMTDLYRSKDNQILHALPVKNDEVFASKLLVYYVNEFIKNLYMAIPLLVAFGFVNMANLSIFYYLNILPMIFILPMLSVFIASLISVPATIVRNFLTNKNILTFFIVLILIIFMFYIVVDLVGRIPTPIRIVQLYNRFVIQLTRIMQASAAYGTIYTVIGRLLFGIQVFVNYLIVIATLLGLGGAVLIISRPLYFTLASKSLEHSVKKIHIKPNKREKSLFRTFLRKELIIARRSVDQLLNNYALLLSLPFFMYTLNYIYMGMNRSTTGNRLVLVFNVIITLLLVTASNTSSATAITTEGSEFVLLKTAPSDTKKMAWAKIAFNLAFSSLVIFISFLLFTWVLPVFPVTDIWLLFLLVILVNSAHILWSFQLDLLNPKLSDYASTGSLSGNVNMASSISNGFIISLVFGVVAVWLFFMHLSFAWPVLILMGIGFLSIRLYLFNSYLKTYFIDIEF